MTIHDLALTPEAWSKMWRRIYSAPKTGDVLLWDGQRVSVGFLWEESGMFFSAGDALIQPTHWMSLPEPPQTSA